MLEEERTTEEVEEPTDPAEPEDTPGDSEGIVLKFKDEDAKQAYFDRVFSSTYKDKRKRIREEERAEVEKELQEKQAKDNEDWKTYAEALQTKVDERDKRITELEGELEQSQPGIERLSATEEALVDLIGPQLERVPEHYRFWINKATAVEKAKWLSENADKLGESETPVSSLTTPGPRKRDVAREQRQEDKEVAEASRQRVSAQL